MGELMNVDGMLTNVLFGYLGAGESSPEVPLKAFWDVSSFVDAYTLVLLCVMVVAGAIGGLAGYFLGGRGRNDDELSPVACAIVGITASLVVPLALNMFSSETLAKGARDPLSLLVFVGVCVLAALFAVRLSCRRPEMGVEQILLLKEGLARIEADLCEPDLSELKPSEMEVVQGDLKADDYRILEGLAQSRFLFRSLSGLAGDTGLGRDLLAKRLPLLVRQGLIRQRLTDEGNIRWALSPRGRLTVNQWVLLRPRDEER
jgi:hypothetical protein